MGKSKGRAGTVSVNCSRIRQDLDLARHLYELKFGPEDVVRFNKSIPVAVATLDRMIGGPAGSTQERQSITHNNVKKLAAFLEDKDWCPASGVDFYSRWTAITETTIEHEHNWITIIPEDGAGGLGFDNTKWLEDGRFRYSILLHISSSIRPIALLEINAEYTDSRGRVCPPHRTTLFIRTRSHKPNIWDEVSISNGINLQPPMRFEDGLFSIRFWQSLLVPNINMMPVDCDKGRLSIQFKFLINGRLRLIQKWYQFRSIAGVIELDRDVPPARAATPDATSS